MTRLVWRRWVGRHPTGIDRVCLAYLGHFKATAQAVIQHPRARRILDRQSSAVLFDLLAQPPHEFRRRLVAKAIRYGIQRSSEGAGRLYLNVGHTGLNDPGFSKWLDESDVRPVYFVHDLIPIAHPEFCRAGERDKHIARMRTVLRTTAGVITNSRATLDDLSDFARSEGMSPLRGLAALLGSDALPDVAAASESERPAFVVLGTIEARKNHLMLLQIWSRLVQQLGPKAPELLVIGQRGWECEQALDLLDRSEVLKDSVVELSGCDDATLARHLRSARALLFPSLVEGYGLPLIEAFQAGTPAIASDLPVFREIAGNIPDYVDPLDGPAWQRAILDYAEESSSMRTSQLERLARYTPPTWQGHFAAVDSWLRTI